LAFSELDEPVVRHGHVGQEGPQDAEAVLLEFEPVLLLVKAGVLGLWGWRRPKKKKKKKKKLKCQRVMWYIRPDTDHIDIDPVLLQSRMKHLSRFWTTLRSHSHATSRRRTASWRRGCSFFHLS
jgi:hypothetical protein